MSDSITARRSQRQPRSCSNCARQKIRCSKAIPCTSCLDRGQQASCHREIVAVTATGKRRRTEERESDSPRVETAEHGYSPVLVTTRHAGTYDGRPAATTPLESPATSDSRHQTHVPHIQNDTVITLEFLSHGRQSILRIGDKAPRMQRAYGESPTEAGTADEYFDWNTTITIDQARLLLTFHEDNIAWMHNVVHMPTFRSEFESCIPRAPYDKSWLALYYALICSTVYHADEARLLEMDISPSTSLVQLFYNQSIQSLYEANFMAVHTLASLQTICVLVQVAYNLDQSDLISVLLSSAIRIAQSLGLHRLGPDHATIQHLPDGMTEVQYLIDREVKKRTWWFLVRQDWLQIPFQNTFVIHANQFNTPMPLNCYENESEMIHDGRIVVQPDTVYTQSSYANEIHKVAIVIWKHQNRMCAVGHPGDNREGILRLYEQTVWADTELKRLYKEMPGFFQDKEWVSSETPHYVKQLYSIHLLSIAHKIHTVHRYFQLQSFRDKTFAFTQQSCVAISQRCIKDIETWPSDSAAHMAMKMWTVTTHIITSCVILTFASIFRNENTLLYDGVEMQRLARVGRETLRLVEEGSSIARRGGALLDALFEIENSLCWSNEAQFNIEDIVGRVLRVDNIFQGDLSLAPEFANAFFDFNVDQIVE